MQSGNLQFFPRAVILAFYADHPAAVKCTVVGKACPQCYTSEGVMHLPPAEGHLPLRTDRKNKRYRSTLSLLRDSKVQGASERAKRRARKLGVSLFANNPFCKDAGTSWVIGPHPDKDCIFQASPQVVLHGSDEGTNAKLARGATELAIMEAIRCHGRSATAVLQPYPC